MGNSPSNRQLSKRSLKIYETESDVLLTKRISSEDNPHSKIAGLVLKNAEIRKNIDVKKKASADLDHILQRESLLPKGISSVDVLLNKFEAQRKEKQEKYNQTKYSIAEIKTDHSGMKAEILILILRPDTISCY